VAKIAVPPVGTTALPAIRPPTSLVKFADPGTTPGRSGRTTLSETELVSTAAPRKRGLSGMVLAELRQLAGELNITDITGMRKGDLIAAIKERQSGGSSAPQLSLPDTTSAPTAPAAGSENGAAAPAPRRRRAASRPAGAPDPKPAADGAAAAAEAPGTERTALGSAPPEASAAAPAAEPSTAPSTAPSTEAPSTEGEGGGRRQRQRRRAEHNGQSAEPVAPAADAGTSADVPAADAGTGEAAPADASVDSGRPSRGSRRERADNRGDNNRDSNRGTDNR